MWIPVRKVSHFESQLITLKAVGFLALQLLSAFIGWEPANARQTPAGTCWRHGRQG